MYTLSCDWITTFYSKLCNINGKTHFRGCILWGTGEAQTKFLQPFKLHGANFHNRTRNPYFLPGFCKYIILKLSSWKNPVTPSSIKTSYSRQTIPSEQEHKRYSNTNWDASIWLEEFWGQIAVIPYSKVLQNNCIILYQQLSTIFHRLH